MSKARVPERQIKAAEATQVSREPIAPISSANSTRPVTQDDLVELSKLRLAARQANQLRTEIVNRLEKGAHVEAGPIEVELRSDESPRLTEAKLMTVLGEKRVEKLKREVTPSPRRCLLLY